MMNSRNLWSALATVVGLAACGGQPESAPDRAAAEQTAISESEHSTNSAGETAGRQAVHLDPRQARALGVTYTQVRRERLQRTIRTVGRIEAAEPKIADITPKIDGFVEDLHVSTTGASVRPGDPLLTLYSPKLVAAQEELLTALRLASRVDSSATTAWSNARDMLEAARRRLTYWDITQAQIARIESTGQVTKTLTLVSPVRGIVLEKSVLAGQQVKSGERLYRIVDLSTVWVEADVFERDLQFVREGQQAHVEVAAYPGVHMMGRVSFVYPTVDERSRTNRVRLTVENPELTLKPGMFATMYLDVEIGADVLTVPREAVIVTGERNLVFVRDSAGMLMPREVVLGASANDRVHILQGLDEGATIVASANFLVDAESRLAGTGGSMPGMQHGHGSAVEPERQEREHDHD